MGTSPEATLRGPEYRLFDSGAVATAAFICCPLAGTVLIAVNFLRLGKTGKGVLAVTLGLIATAVNILIKWNWRTSSGSLGRLEFDAFELVFWACTWVCTWQAAKEEQGDAIKEHTARGGQLASRSTAVLVGFETLAALLVVAGAAIYAYQYRKIAIIGATNQVVYSGLATKAEAIALGNALEAREYFHGRGPSVLFNKGFDSTTISFVLQDRAWDQPGILSSAEELTREVAPTVGGLPIEVRLVDSRLDVENASTVGEARFDGNDGVYYEGSATKQEARALGRRLKSMGFFRGKGANVLLTKHDDGTIVAFVVICDAWKEPKKLSMFETIVRDVAPMVGGLPIDMQLVNPQLEVQKDELIGDDGE